MTTFSELPLHPAIARALAARGYENATDVQAAVMEAAHEGRDLLVSSQTGSGKTVAFGAALAQTLLADGSTPRAERGAPLALVVVPTRELAVQVREELSWLLGETGLRLASFTGGTAVGGDLRSLQQGVDVAIGTPGRLVDLIRRERLKLAAVRVVVLDEADEMLDLGFREDLTTLLQASPPERRTLLLSATMPPEIQAMAKRFQRDAVRVDVRRTAGADGKQGHNDITYVAHLISGSDRLAAVVNVLRAGGGGRAIVFVTTRDSVSRLHEALVARGFAATAISGERAQNERDRALEQLRKGDAQVLVATNVAARGLHLPDVDLIIHADLPLNAESLTHRSGRTGRAGRKGTAVVIASLSERRKAERLLASAHVQFTWTAPPDAEAITDAARERLLDELLASETGTAAEAGTGEEAPLSEAAATKAAKAAAYRARKRAATEALLQRLETTVDAREVALRLLQRELDRLPGGERIHPVAIPAPGARRDEDSGPKPGRSDFSRNGVVFSINIGAKDNADPRWLLPLICRRGGVTRRDVGAIRIGPRGTEFEIAPGAAEDFALAAAERDPRAPHVTIERAGGGPRATARPSRPERPARAERPHRAEPSSPPARTRAIQPPPVADEPEVEAPPVSTPPVASRPPAAAPKVLSTAALPAQPPEAAPPAPAPAAREREKSDGPVIETKRARPIAAPARRPAEPRPAPETDDAPPRRPAPPAHRDKPAFAARGPRAADGDRPSFAPRGPRAPGGDRPAFAARGPRPTDRDRDRPAFAPRGPRAHGGDRPAFSPRGPRAADRDRPTFTPRSADRDDRGFAPRAPRPTDRDKPAFARRGTHPSDRERPTFAAPGPRSTDGNSPPRRAAHPHRGESTGAATKRPRPSSEAPAGERPPFWKDARKPARPKSPPPRR